MWRPAREVKETQQEHGGTVFSHLCGETLPSPLCFAVGFPTVRLLPLLYSSASRELHLIPHGTTARLRSVVHFFSFWPDPPHARPLAICGCIGAAHSKVMQLEFISFERLLPKLPFEEKWCYWVKLSQEWNSQKNSQCVSCTKKWWTKVGNIILGWGINRPQR